MVAINKVSYVIHGDWGSPIYYRKAIGEQAEYHRQRDYRQVTIVNGAKVCVMAEDIIISADTPEQALTVRDEVFRRLDNSVFEYAVTDEGFLKHVLSVSNENISNVLEMYDWEETKVAYMMSVNNWRVKVYPDDNIICTYGSLETRKESKQFIDQLLDSSFETLFEEN